MGQAKAATVAQSIIHTGTFEELTVAVDYLNRTYGPTLEARVSETGETWAGKWYIVIGFGPDGEWVRQVSQVQDVAKAFLAGYRLGQSGTAQ